MLSITDENLIIEQLDKSTPEAWLALMRYFGRVLIEDGQQRFLAEIICREAERRAGTNRPANALPNVLADLELKLVTTSGSQA